MRTLSRLLLLALLAHAAAFAVPASAQAQDAIAVNKKDGKSVFKLAFSVKKASGDVDATNTALAYASCTDCKTVAAAIQVVLVSDVDSASAENVSLAINYQCTECETLAAAYQFVFADGQEIEFTKEGKQRLHDLKKRFHDLKQRDDLTLEQLAAEIAAIAGEVAEVVDTEVVLKKEKEWDGRPRRRPRPPATLRRRRPRRLPPAPTRPRRRRRRRHASPDSTSAPTTSPPTTAATVRHLALDDCRPVIAAAARSPWPSSVTALFLAGCGESTPGTRALDATQDKLDDVRSGTLSLRPAGLGGRCRRRHGRRLPARGALRGRRRRRGRSPWPTSASPGSPGPTGAPPASSAPGAGPSSWWTATSPS